ncbi:MAG: rRNA pseudouridine synthase [Actinomycetia bacterium]|nr:rRNA pseudouridine synthase [Actinomycetes bacterium]
MLIAQGRVTVDGVAVHVGDRLDPATTDLAIDGIRLPLDTELVTWLLYKPPGVITTMDDPQGRPTVRTIVPAEPVTNPVGRLDLHSEGLMLMTNDGDLALRVTHPRYRVPKTYQVLVPASVAPSILHKMVSGVMLDDGMAAAKSARVLDTSRGRTIIELVLTEGRKREIRRLFESFDLPIERLVRTAIGEVVDRTLDPGSFRELTMDEIRSLYRLAAKETDR